MQCNIFPMTHPLLSIFKTGLCKLVILVFSLTAACQCKSAEELKPYANSYGIKILIPSEWDTDEPQQLAAKVKLNELIFKIRLDEKITILSTGPSLPSLEGYARIRLSITTDFSLSQEEIPTLSESELNSLLEPIRKELLNSPIFRVDPSTITTSITRTDGGHFGIKITYIRTGLNGPVKVQQYHYPFSNRTVLLTTSYNSKNEHKFAPLMLKVLSSLQLEDEQLWPKCIGR